jgi:hypothetical protein
MIDGANLEVWFPRPTGYATDEDLGRTITLDGDRIGIVTKIEPQDDGRVMVYGQIQDPYASSEEVMWGILDRLDIIRG